MIDFIKARYVLALMGFTGMMIQYILKVNLSLAIVAMVAHNTNQTLESEENIEDVCPDVNSANNTSTSTQHGDFQWNTDVESQVLASYYYGYVATQLIGGRSSEIIGPKLVMGYGVLFTGIFTLISPFAAKLSAYAFITVRVLEGACSGVIIPAMQVLFSKWFPPEERSKFSGIVFSAIHVGSLLAMALSGVIERIGGWEWIFYFSGIISVLWVVPWLLLVFNTPNEHPRISKSELIFIATGTKTCMNNSGDKEDKISSAVPWKNILLSKKIWSAALVQFGTAWVMYTLLSELPIYLKRVHHFNIQSSGIISALPYLFDWISCTVCGLISQWLQIKGYLSKKSAYLIFNAIACIGSAICLLGITLASCDTTVIIILLIVTMVCNGAFYGGSYLNHLDLAPNFAGSISGIIHTFVNSAGIWTPLVVALITEGQDTLSRWKNVFYVSMVIISFPYIVYLFYGSVEELEWNRINQKTNASKKVVPVTEL